jgi:hypothetical protein
MLFIFVNVVTLIVAPSMHTMGLWAQRSDTALFHIGSDMVWDAPDEAIQRIRDQCASAVNQRACFISIMKNSGASLQAIAFTRQFKKGVGYLKSFNRQGPVDIAKIVCPLIPNSNEATFLVNGKPSMIDVSELTYLSRIDIRKDKLYSTLKKKDKDIRIWPDDTIEPVVQPGINDRTEVEIKFPLKSCPTCQILGYAVVVYDFDHTGRFLGVRLIDLVEQ